MDISRTMTISPDTADRSKLTDRDRLVIEIAKQTAIGLRRSAASHSITRVRDFVDGLTFAGMLVQKNTPGTETPPFAEIVATMTPVFRRVVETRQIKDAEASLADMKGRLGVVTQSPSQMIVNLGLTAEGIIADIAREYTLSKQECLQVLAFAIVFAIMATSPPEDLDADLDALIVETSEKIAHWDGFIPSDEEMFGDMDWGDEDDEDDEDGGADDDETEADDTPH